MADRWYCLVNGIRHGPLALDELQRMAREGKLGPDDFVKLVDADEWRCADSLPGLFEHQPATYETVADTVPAANSSPAATTLAAEDVFRIQSEPRGPAPGTPTCSNCGGPILANAIICVACGFDPKIGQKVARLHDARIDCPWYLGVTIGAVGIVVIGAGTCLGVGMLLEMGDTLAGAGAAVGGLLTVGFALWLLRGTRTLIAVTSRKRRPAWCVVERRLAGWPVFRTRLELHDGDRLVTDYKGELSLADVGWWLLVVLMCGLGFFPGILLFFFWRRIRRKPGGLIQFYTLELRSDVTGERHRLFTGQEATMQEIIAAIARVARVELCR